MWRNTGQPVRLLMLDARACLPILCVMVYWSWPTLYIAISGVAFFSTISFFGLTLDIVRNPQALLGYRLRGIGAGHFATVMLATMEATAQVAEPSAIVVNELNTLWSAATDRIERQTRLSPQAGAGAAP